MIKNDVELFKTFNLNLFWEFMKTNYFFDPNEDRKLDNKFGEIYS